MTIVDFTVPEPLLQPQAWPTSSAFDLEGRQILWILPLNIAVSSGGPVRHYFKSLLKAAQVAWRVELAQFRDHPHFQSQVEIRRNAAKMWLQSKRVLLEQSSIEEFREIFKISGPVEILNPPADTAKGDVGTWLTRIAPHFATEFSAKFKISDYLNEIGTGEFDFPWEALRFLAGYLQRQRKFDSAWALEWSIAYAKFLALYSPQDEEVEKNALARGELKLNPTLQMVRSPEGKKAFIDLFVRDGFAVTELRIFESEAYWIDEAMEKTRLSQTEIPALDEPTLNRLIEKKIFLSSR
jgi:hypothetical protein